MGPSKIREKVLASEAWLEPFGFGVGWPGAAVLSVSSTMFWGSTATRRLDDPHLHARSGRASKPNRLGRVELDLEEEGIVGVGQIANVVTGARRETDFDGPRQSLVGKDQRPAVLRNGDARVDGVMVNAAHASSCDGDRPEWTVTLLFGFDKQGLTVRSPSEAFHPRVWPERGPRFLWGGVPRPRAPEGDRIRCRWPRTRPALSALGENLRIRESLNAFHQGAENAWQSQG
jgi:hypothetical protein